MEESHAGRSPPSSLPPSAGGGAERPRSALKWKDYWLQCWQPTTRGRLEARRPAEWIQRDPGDGIGRSSLVHGRPIEVL